MKRSTSLKKSRQRVPSNKEVETPKGSKCGSERSRASQLPVAGSRSSGKACSVLGAKNDSKSQSICNSVVGAERRAAFSCSEESEVSVQSLLDQSEFSLLTSSPEAKMPIGYAVRDLTTPRPLNYTLYSGKGKKKHYVRQGKLSLM